MTETVSTESQITDYRGQWSTDEKLDFIAYHLRLIVNRLDLLDAKTDKIGQLTTNVDEFCQQVSAAVSDMRKNPLMRSMVPPGLTPPPGKLLH